MSRGAFWETRARQAKGRVVSSGLPACFRSVFRPSERAKPRAWKTRRKTRALLSFCAWRWTSFHSLLWGARPGLARPDPAGLDADVQRAVGTSD